YKRGISLVKKTVYSSIIIILGGVINVILNYWLIPIYGMQAAAFTTLIAYVIQFLMTFIVVKYVLKVYVTGISKIIWKILLVVLSGLLYFGLQEADFSFLLDIFCRLIISVVLIFLIVNRTPKQLYQLIKK
ncbi:MAG: polysaccharide biosynthesis C-terminal domain-containing protein, partial [Bacteroidetes bacterium]|nr:polysaccharide biosynthesis C-terminal domain-containing protein [Bacteroidota bacterium]